MYRNNYFKLLFIYEIKLLIILEVLDKYCNNPLLYSFSNFKNYFNY